MEQFAVTGEYIELMGLLKALGIAETGGHAKHNVDSGIVYRNGQIETRRRAKLIKGDILLIEDLKVELI